MEERKPKILIVDDDAANLLVMEGYLGMLDVQISSARSGAAALALSQEHEFCVAVVDVQMPHMDGYQLAETLRDQEHTATLPVIFVSALYDSEYHHLRGYEAGAVDFLVKPLVPEILLSKVRVFVEQYRQRVRLEELVAQVRNLNEELEAKVQERTTELEHAYHQLELLDRSKSDFIQVVSHELRTPLTLIKGYGQLLQREVQQLESENMTFQLAGIMTGANRMHEIIDSMLDMVKIDSRALNLELGPVKLAHLFASLQRDLAQSVADRQLTLQITGLDELPPIEADGGLLKKVFEHLLVNAIKYTPDGGSITVTAHLLGAASGDPQQTFVEVIVSDTGIGIAPEAQELIFTKFYQAGDVTLHSSSRTNFKGGGPGLGLAIARGIAEAHQGRIWVESPGYDEETCPGSDFHVVLPVSQTLGRFRSGLETHL